MADEEIQGQDQQENDAIEETEEAAEQSLEDKLKEKVDVRVEEIGSLRKKMTVTVPGDLIAEQLDGQYDELRREAQVPGFRRGRAPRRLLEKRFGEEVTETLTQQVVATAYSVAIEKSDLKVLGDPMVWVKEKDAESETLLPAEEAIPKIELPEEGDLSYSVEIEVRPEFDLPNLEGIPVKKPKIEVTDENIDKQIDYIRGMRATFEPVPEGPVEKDDVVYADVKMTSDGTVLKEQPELRFNARSQTIDGVQLENLGDVLAGAKVGDVKTTSGEIPDTFYKVEFRGKKADFEFTVRKIERQVLPEMNEEFVKSLGAESQDQLREWVKSDLEGRIGQEQQRAMRDQVYQYLLEHADFELPERLSETQTERVIVRRMLEMYQQGVPPTEVQKLMDEVRTSAKQDVANDLKLVLVMEKLSEEFETEVTEEEMNGRIAMIAQMRGQRFDRVRDELIQGQGVQNLYVQVRDEKIIGKLLEKAEVAEADPEELAKEQEAKKSKAKKSTKKKDEAGKSSEGDESEST